MTTIKKQITEANIECEKNNPHFNDAQITDYVYFKVFGEYSGSELDKRNMSLCK